jgi:hypothetical protein
MKLVVTHDAFQGETIREGTEDELMEFVDFLLDHVTLCDHFAGEPDPEKTRREQIALHEDDLIKNRTFEGYGIRLKLGNDQ